MEAMMESISALRRFNSSTVPSVLTVVDVQ